MIYHVSWLAYNVNHWCVIRSNVHFTTDAREEVQVWIRAALLHAFTTHALNAD